MYLPIKDERDPSYRILDESENYYLIGSCETVYLLSKKIQNPITKKYKVITSPGEHYGDVMAGFIDKKERYCVTVGHGYDLCYLHEPYEILSDKQFAERPKDKWIENLFEPAKLRFFDDVRQIDDWEFEIIDADSGEWERIRIQQPEELVRLQKGYAKK